MKAAYLMATLGLSIILAHPGRTDADGGHYDRSTGEYHYHHGYEAHQHENGECPFDYDVLYHSNGVQSNKAKEEIEENHTIDNTEVPDGTIGEHYEYKDEVLYETGKYVLWIDNEPIEITEEEKEKLEREAILESRKAKNNTASSKEEEKEESKTIPLVAIGSFAGGIAIASVIKKRK